VPDESDVLFIIVLLLIIVFASEIGLGFSPDTPNASVWGFSPWDTLFLSDPTLLLYLRSPAP
jgi:hypothetical protein